MQSSYAKLSIYQHSAESQRDSQRCQHTRFPPELRSSETARLRARRCTRALKSDGSFRPRPRVCFSTIHGKKKPTRFQLSRLPLHLSRKIHPRGRKEAPKAPGERRWVGRSENKRASARAGPGRGQRPQLPAGAAQEGRRSGPHSPKSRNCFMESGDGEKRA